MPIPVSRILWLASIALEAAVLARYWRRGGFTAFRTMICCDIIAQLADIAVAGTSWYRPVFRVGDVTVCIATAFAVLEAGRRMPVKCTRQDAGAILGISLGIHVLLCNPMPWYSVAGFVWSTVALGHLLGGIWLCFRMADSGPVTIHNAVFAVYLLAIAWCFYLAPVLSMGLVIMLVNLAGWVGFLCNHRENQPALR